MENENLNTIYKDLVKNSRKFWEEIANENGWSMKERGVTVWIDKDLNLIDSLYNPSDSDTSYIVNKETEQLIIEILNMDSKQLDKVIKYVNERRNQLSSIKKLEFSIGDEVWIDHKSHGKNEIYIVEGINTKTISVKIKDGFRGYRVPPGMLNLIEK